MTASTPIRVATAPVDFRKAIDGFGALCQHGLGQDRRSGTLYGFSNRARTMLRILAYEHHDNGAGRGYGLCAPSVYRADGLSAGRGGRSRSARWPRTVCANGSSVC